MKFSEWYVPNDEYCERSLLHWIETGKWPPNCEVKDVTRINMIIEILPVIIELAKTHLAVKLHLKENNKEIADSMCGMIDEQYDNDYEPDFCKKCGAFLDEDCNCL